jgi:hypothetical protein
MKSLITSLLVSSAIAVPLFNDSVLDKRQRQGGGGGNSGIGALVGGFLNSESGLGLTFDQITDLY